MTTQVLAGIIADSHQQPTEAELLREEKKNHLLPYTVDLEAAYEEDETTFMIGGVNAFGRKDLVCIKAKQKSGKSHLNAIFMAAAQGGSWNEVKCVLPKCKTLYIDTEQKVRDTQHIVHKALRMAGSELKNSDSLKVMNLRDVTSTEECRQLVHDAVDAFKPDLVIIDGVVDLIDDFNDVTQSQQLVRELMKMSDEGNCCFITVLHTNKSADDHNMRGHLGTILAQKASCVFECRKDTKTNFVQVVCTDYRHAPVPDFYFAFDGNGEVISVTEIANSMKDAAEAAKADKKAAEEEKKFLERYEKVKALFTTDEPHLIAANLRKKIINEKIYSKNQVTSFIEKLVERGLLVATSDGTIYSLPQESVTEESDPQGTLDFED